MPQKIEELELSIIYHPNYQTMIDNGSKAPAGYLRCVNNFNPAIHLSLPYHVQEVQINNKSKRVGSFIRMIISYLLKRIQINFLIKRSLLLANCFYYGWILFD